MTTKVLIEWRDSFESDSLYDTFGRAAALARAGRRVTLILVRDGVTAAVRGGHTFWFAELGRLGVEILADAASLRERGIPLAKVSRRVRPAALALPIDALIEQRRSEWTVDDPLALAVN